MIDEHGLQVARLFALPEDGRGAHPVLPQIGAGHAKLHFASAQVVTSVFARPQDNAENGREDDSRR